MGTFVNGKREKQIVLQDDDKISLAGVIQFRFIKGVLSSSNSGVRAKTPVPVHQPPPAPSPAPSVPYPQDAHYPVNQHEMVREHVHPNSQPYLRPGISTGYKISMPGALIAILLFFLPWVRVSLFEMGIGINGWQFAAGVAIDDIVGDLELSGFAGILGLDTSGRIPGEPIIFIILVAAILALFLFVFSFRRGMVMPVPDGIGTIALGTISLLMLLIFCFNVKDLSSELSFMGISSVKIQFGLWGTILSYIAVIIGGILNLIEATSSSRS